MNRRNLINALAFTGLALAANVARAADRPLVKLSKAFAYLDLYYALPPGQRSRFALAYYAYRDRKPAPDLKVYLVPPSGPRRQIALDRGGRVEALPSLADLRGPDMVAVDASQSDKIGLRLEIEARVPPGATIDVHDLDLALSQAAAAIAADAGVLRFALPKLTCAYFLGGGPGHAVLADGRSAPLPSVPSGEGAGTAYFDSEAMANARTVVLARPPARISLGPHPR